MHVTQHIVAVNLGHHQVKQQHVRFSLSQDLENPIPGTRFRNHFHVRLLFEQLPKPLP